MNLIRILLILWVLAGTGLAAFAAGLGTFIVTHSEGAAWCTSIAYAFSLLLAFQMVGDGRPQPLRLDGET